jgi:hypothetical protein
MHVGRFAVNRITQDRGHELDGRRILVDVRRDVAIFVFLRLGDVGIVQIEYLRLVRARKARSRGFLFLSE